MFILATRQQGPEGRPQLAFKGVVDRGQDLPSGAEVGLQRGACTDLLKHAAALLKQLDIGIPEAVDRLLRVTDHEQIDPGDQVDQLQLYAVGVLHLIDHHACEAFPVLTPDVPSAQDLTGQQFKVLKVHTRALALEFGVPLVIGPEQPVEGVACVLRMLVNDLCSEFLERGPVALAGVAAQGARRTGGQLDRIELSRPGHSAGEHARGALNRCQAGQDLLAGVANTLQFATHRGCEFDHLHAGTFG